MNRGIRNHRLGRLEIALGILFVSAVASPAAAEHVAYVSGSLEDSCLAGATVPACTRGVISVVNTDTTQVTGTIDVWRHDVFSVIDVLPNLSGTRLYVVLFVSGFSETSPAVGVP